MPSRFRHLLVRAAVATALASLVPAGCRRGATPVGAAGPPAARERVRASLALIPSEARIVIGVDLESLRASPPGRELHLGVVRRAAARLTGVAQGMGIDPLADVRSFLLAVPGERQADDRSILVAELARFDAARAATWLGQDHGPATAIFVREGRWLVIAKGAWATVAPALARAGSSAASAAGDDELGHLCQRAAQDQAMWLAAVVPATLRRRLETEGSLADVASIMRLHVTARLAADLRVRAVAELSNEPDARTLVHRLAAYVKAAKQHPDVLTQGLAPYLEGLRLNSRGPEVDATLELPASQIADLAARLEDLVGSHGLASAARP